MLRESKQWYDKPNRGAGTSVTLDSNPKEYDTFLDRAGRRGTPCSASRLVRDTNVSYNNTHFPLDQKTDLQPILDNSTRRAAAQRRQQRA